MTEILFVVSSALVLSCFFIGRFVFLRDRHPNTDLLLMALHTLEPPPGDSPEEGP
jgi:hypothetical protein